jgi:hypothetical protein
MGRYESEVIMVPRELQSAGDSYMIRNVSTSQEMRPVRVDRSKD